MADAWLGRLYQHLWHRFPTLSLAAAAVARLQAARALRSGNTMMISAARAALTSVTSGLFLGHGLNRHCYLFKRQHPVISSTHVCSHGCFRCLVLVLYCTHAVEPGASCVSNWHSLALLCRAQGDCAEALAYVRAAQRALEKKHKFDATVPRFEPVLNLVPFPKSLSSIPCI